MTAVPMLETARLRLRGYRASDFADSMAMWTDMAVVRHISGRPSTAEEAWARLLRYSGLWPLLGYGYWAVEEKASGRFVGDVGFADFKRDLQPSFGDAPEAGWVLAPWAHGRGFATEALGAAVAWGDRHFGAAPTVCMIAPENATSIRVAQKCGYREYARATYKGEPAILFRRDGVLR